MQIQDTSDVAEAKRLLDDARECVATMEVLSEWSPFVQTDNGEWISSAETMPGYQGLERRASGLLRDARRIVEALEASTRVHA